MLNSGGSRSGDEWHDHGGAALPGFFAVWRSRSIPGPPKKAVELAKPKAGENGNSRNFASLHLCARNSTEGFAPSVCEREGLAFCPKRIGSRKGAETQRKILLLLKACLVEF